MGRNKAPSENTIRILCGRAGGMCEFEGCDKRLFYDNVTRSQFNNAFVAHIVASSSNGPRGDKIKSPELSDKIENLMLMCADHHKLIDIPTTGPRDYPVDKLKEMKRKHEEKIEKFCSLFYIPQTEIVRFTSPIKGVNIAEVDYNKASYALLPNYQPASTFGITISISSSYEYATEEYWDDCLRQLNFHYQRTLSNAYLESKKMHLSVFSLAPIPLIAKLGELIGDKFPCNVYQKTRTPDTWEWQSKDKTNMFEIVEKVQENQSKKIAVILSLTDDISCDRISEIDQYRVIYKIKASKNDVDCIKSEKDLSLFWHAYQKICDEVLNNYGRDMIIHMFPAIPVSAAFELGRRYMPNTYPKILLYDEHNGFKKALMLGE